MAARVRIGDMLIQSGMLTPAKLEEALADQKKRGVGRLGDILVERGFVSEVQLTQTLSNQLSVPWVSLYHVDFSRQLLNLVPREIAEKFCLIPVYVRAVRKAGDTLFVAMDDPTNEDALGAVRTAAEMPVKAMVAPPSEIKNAIRVYYAGGADVHETVEGRATMPVAKRKEPAASPAQAPAAPAKPPPPAPAGAAPKKTEPRAEIPTRQEKRPKSDQAMAAAGGAPKAKKARMIALTLLDGTTVTLPAPGAQHGEQPPAAEESLTAGDMVAALRAAAHGADVSDVLPNRSWEPIVAALISLLLKKHLIADWEFVDELKKQQGP